MHSTSLCRFVLYSMNTILSISLAITITHSFEYHFQPNLIWNSEESAFGLFLFWIFRQINFLRKFGSDQSVFALELYIIIKNHKCQRVAQSKWKIQSIELEWSEVRRFSITAAKTTQNETTHSTSHSF